MSKDASFGTGAVRSADADHLDFMSLPIIGLLGVARTAHEGGTKYGRFNYLLGMPAHTCVNHAIRHLFLWAMGDRSEPHLSHAAWGCMTAEQSCVLHPELNAPHLPSPGFTLDKEAIDFLLAEKPERDRARKAGEFDHLADWTIDRLPEVRKVLDLRAQALARAEADLGDAIDTGPTLFDEPAIAPVDPAILGDGGPWTEPTPAKAEIDRFGNPLTARSDGPGWQPYLCP